MTYMSASQMSEIKSQSLKCQSLSPPKNGLIALWPSTNGRVSTFEYCQVVFCQILRLLSTDILVHQRLSMNLDIKVSKLLYQWTL